MALIHSLVFDPVDPRSSLKTFAVGMLNSTTARVKVTDLDDLKNYDKRQAPAGR